MPSTDSPPRRSRRLLILGVCRMSLLISATILVLGMIGTTRAARASAGRVAAGAASPA